MRGSTLMAPRTSRHLLMLGFGLEVSSLRIGHGVRLQVQDDRFSCRASGTTNILSGCLEPFLHQDYVGLREANT